MTKLWIIDGHNILHGSKELKALLHREPSGYSAQKRLVERVRLLTDFAGDDAILVFDSRHIKTLNEKWLEKQKQGKLKVYYGSADVQADTIIERELVVSGKSKRVSLVSEDRAIRNVAHASGAFNLSLQDFEQTLESLQKRQARELASKRQASDDSFQNGLPL